MRCQMPPRWCCAQPVLENTISAVFLEGMGWRQPQRSVAQLMSWEWRLRFALCLSAAHCVEIKP
jgi:hypothetical protein